MSVWIPQDPVTGTIPPTYEPVTSDDERLAPLDWSILPHRAGSDSMHHIVVDGRRIEVRPDTTTVGSTRGKAIRAALRNLEMGDIDPVTYIRGALAAVGATAIEVVKVAE